MHKYKAVKLFGSDYRLAKALGIHRSAVSRWGRIVPELRARQIADLSAGKLTFDPKLYTRATR
jgi:DNA-binding transcriptional regulator YdaS (Cro superfamily)